jgi:hypothetical protein
MLAAAHLLHRHERNGSRHHVRFVAALAEPFVLVVCPRDQFPMGLQVDPRTGHLFGNVSGRLRRFDASTLVEMG